METDFFTTIPLFYVVFAFLFRPKKKPGKMNENFESQRRKDMKRTIIAAALSANAANAATYCFESDKADVASRSPWSHHHFVLLPEAPLPMPDGRVFMGVRGYGHNEAPTPNGGTDLVPLTGAAVKDVDGSWIVSTQGTLIQKSMLAYSDHAGIPSYWMISQNWILDSTATEGVGHYGNLITPFNKQFSHTLDDSVDVEVWRVACPVP